VLLCFGDHTVSTGRDAHLAARLPFVAEGGWNFGATIMVLKRTIQINSVVMVVTVRSPAIGVSLGFTASLFTAGLAVPGGQCVPNGPMRPCVVMPMPWFFSASKVGRWFATKLLALH